jgi:MoxR-like ATPase
LSEPSSSEPTSVVERLNAKVVGPLKQRFVGREEVVDLIALAVAAGEHLFLFGPPGTAKSALIRRFASAVSGRYFEYMLTRFSEPNEIFGPVDLAALREGRLTTNTAGMLPEAEFVFLDELFNANSAILNNLLTVLNERTYRRGSEVRSLPMLSLFSASNSLPENEALAALFDRFLLRCRVDNLPRERMGELLAAGWALESAGAPESGVSAEELRELSRRVFDVDLAAVRGVYAETVFKIRDLGVGFSDRRAVKAMKLIAASTLLCGRSSAAASDLWVLRYVWDREEQIGPLAALINGVLERHAGAAAGAHPRSAPAARADPEELAKELDAAERELGSGPAGLAALARLRERLTDLSDRAAWVGDEAARRHLLERAAAALRRMG